MPEDAMSYSCRSCEQRWTKVVSSQDARSLGSLRELMEYRDLLAVLVQKDFSYIFRQTRLGPLWIVLNPIISTLVFAVALGFFARVQTDGAPVLLFYLTGGVLWAYFANAFTSMCQVLSLNRFILEKVYVPRILLPLAAGLTALLKFLSVLVVCLPVYIYYAVRGQASPNLWLAFLPLLVCLLFMLTLGMGLSFASLTVKRRDLGVLIPFWTSVLMFASPVLYPASTVPDRLQTLYSMNPLTGIFECFRFAMIGTGQFTPSMLFISGVMSTLALFVGLSLFRQVGSEAPDYL